MHVATSRAAVTARASGVVWHTSSGAGAAACGRSQASVASGDSVYRAAGEADAAADVAVSGTWNRSTSSPAIVRSPSGGVWSSGGKNVRLRPSRMLRDRQKPRVDACMRGGVTARQRREEGKLGPPADPRTQQARHSKLRHSTARAQVTLARECSSKARPCLRAPHGLRARDGVAAAGCGVPLSHACSGENGAVHAFRAS